MPAGLDGQGAFHTLGVQANSLINNVPVAALVAVMLPTPIVNEALEPRRGDGVGYDGLSGFLVQENGGNQRNQPVTVDFPAIRIHDSRAVTVRVKDDAQVCANTQHRLPQGCHRLSVFRVGDMIGEVAIGLQELAALNPRTEAFQQLCIEAARTVTGIHHHMQSQQRLCQVSLQSLADAVFQLFHISG